MEFSGHTAGLGADVVVHAVTVYNGELVVYGYFLELGSVARWDGSAWTGFGSGVSVYYPFQYSGDLAVYEDELYVGGNISTAGGNPSMFMARWIDSPTTVPTLSDETSTPFDLLPLRPNPFEAGTTVHYRISDRLEVDLAVYDATGRLIRNLRRASLGPGTYTTDWSADDHFGRRVSPGVYFFRLSAQGMTRTQKAVLKN